MDPSGVDPDAPTARLGPEGLRAVRPGSGGVPRLDGAGVVPPDTPPDSAKSTARQVLARDVADAATPKRIKWIPHTHSNPLHARFCYMCLHGALEGKEEFLAAQDQVGQFSCVSRRRSYTARRSF